MARFRRSKLPDILPDSVWAYSRAEAFNPDDWLIRSWGWWESPAKPQSAPGPFPGADKYTRFGFIPSLKQKAAAKKEKSLENLARFAAEIKRLCVERKAQFKLWNKKLRETLGSHSNSHVGLNDTKNCPRCGASLFTKKRLECFECGYTLGEVHYQPRKRDQTSYQDAHGLLPVQEITKKPDQRRRRHLTPEQFVAGLILRGKLEGLTNPALLGKAAGAYQILCEGWLPRDVAAFSDDSEIAIERRAERLFDTVTKHEATGQPLPRPNFNDINRLKQNLYPVCTEIPYIRRDLCSN